MPEYYQKNVGVDEDYYEFIELGAGRGEGYLSETNLETIFRQMLVYKIDYEERKEKPYNAVSKVKDEEGLQESYNVRRDYLQKVLGPKFDGWCKESEKSLYIESLKYELKRVESSIKSHREKEDSLGNSLLESCKTSSGEFDAVSYFESPLSSTRAFNLQDITNEQERAKKILTELQSLGVELDINDLDLGITE